MASRLKGHPSPYLEQHADNPVDWWPWCDEAFATARERDVPIFLSIGYATCHWCHVMAHESFEDPDVAAAMNEAFVCIKVDREERPDIDGVYMAACQAATGSGGWPLTALLDHQKRPWFVGTYFPKTGRGGRPGMTELVPKLSNAWQTQRQDLQDSASHLVSHLQREAATPAPLAEDTLSRAVTSLATSFDPAHGGFGQRPKFPSPHNLRLLLAHGGEQGRQMVATTLDGMLAGGLHDHVGGGFHRYSTDERWLLPHFEKMLYDQATMLQVLTEAWQVFGNPRYETAAVRLVEYVLRDLGSEAGGFYSAEDADSEGEEGTFYVWSRQELEHLGEDFLSAFGVQVDGNFHDESTGKRDPRNILHTSPGLDTTVWHDALGQLRATRSNRPRPLRDEKVLADWNGLFITSLARAAMTFSRPDWLERAIAGGRFLSQDMMLDGLRHRWRDGAVDDHGFLDDHGAVGLAFVTLFECTSDPSWLQLAESVASDLIEQFATPGGFATAPADGEAMILRQVEAYDGAMPSGNALAVELLDRLGRITNQSKWQDAAQQCVSALAPQANAHPHGYTAFLVASHALRHGREVVTTAQHLATVSWQTHAPDALRIHRQADTGIDWIDAHPAGKEAAYVCRNRACLAPVHDAVALRKAIEQ